MSAPFGDFYRGRTVLVTGHTGFKGSWLATWLTHLGARVVGYALDPPSQPSNFEASRLAGRVESVRADIRDFEALLAAFRAARPEVVFHLAAQPIVRVSYAEPRLTFEVNVMGTVNLLEAARQTDSVEALVSITSDKCYLNREWAWGYRETDELGGHDAYSASKACAELAIAAYRDSRFQRSSGRARRLPVASTRAGNVIGGGDWARDRVVPDTIRAIVARGPIRLRHPAATRPWVHVLEPLGGYLWLGAALVRDPERASTAFNFGPAEPRGYAVREIVEGIFARWPAAATAIAVDAAPAGSESGLLRLDCSRAEHILGWSATWSLAEALDAIVAWYRAYHAGSPRDMYDLSLEQIEAYAAAARERGQAWAGGPARTATGAEPGMSRE